jgi:LPXTG-motif cell wall-anchored protein
LPLAILIFAALAAGVTVAIIQPGDLGKKDHEVTEPQPTAVQPSPSITATLAPSPTPTPEPTEEPTEEPTVEPTGNGGNGNGGGHNGPVLADTGGAVLPWFFWGALLFAGGAALWRLRRRLV